MAEKYESFDLSGTKIYVSEDHRFGTDAFLLADFADPAPHHKVCDLCTGCGIVPLIMCRNISKKPPKEIYGIEIMPEAVELFDKSVAENNLSDRIKPVLCDLKDPQGVPREYFDIVTVNPPYWKKGSGEERLSDVQAAARHEMPNAGKPFCACVASTDARYTAPGRSVPLKPHTPFIVIGSISIVSAP